MPVDAAQDVGALPVAAGVAELAAQLPEVPAVDVRDTMSAPALRERAQHTYRLARERGQRVTGAVLGDAYGRGERWGRQQIEAVEVLEEPAAAPPAEASSR